MDAFSDSLSRGLIFPPRIVLPTSWVGHVPFGAWIVANARPRRIVELGVHTGNSFFTFCEAARVAQTNTECIGVDTWAGDAHAGFYANTIYDDVAGLASSRYPQIARLIRATFDEALAQIEDGSVDLLHIDGLHTYDAVRHDFETWRPKLSDRAVVLFHDTQVRHGDFGVWQYWAEIGAHYPHFEFTHSNGLGVLLVGERALDIVASLTDAHESAAKRRQIFDALGSYLVKTITSGPGSAQLIFDSKLDPPKVYFSADGGALSEENSATASLKSTDEPYVWVASLPSIEFTDSGMLRVDPTTSPGLRVYSAIKLENRRTGQQIDFDWEAGHADHDMSITRTAEGTVCAMLSGDGHFVLAPSPEAKAFFSDGADLIFVSRTIAPERVSTMFFSAVRTALSHQRVEGEEAHARQIAATTALDRAHGDAEAIAQEAQSLRDELSQSHLARAHLENEVQQLREQLASATQHASSSESMATELTATRTLTRQQEDEIQRLRGFIGERLRPRTMAERLKHAAASLAMLVRPLPLRVTLRARSGLVSRAGRSQTWESTNIDPQFDFSGLEEAEGRWVRLRMRLTTNSIPALRPKLYLEGFRAAGEEGAVPLMILDPANGRIDTLMHIPTHTRRVRFDPCDYPGEFQVTDVSVDRLSKPWLLLIALRRAMRLGRATRFCVNVARLAVAARDGARRAEITAYLLKLATPTIPPPVEPDRYAEWIALREPPRGTYSDFTDAATRWPHQPLISVVMPTYETPPALLAAAIDSVIAQTYPHWELCIADDASKNLAVRDTLERYAARDRRIRIVYRSENGHIARASNSALELAQGEFIALLDHDDELHPLALHYVAEAINAHPDAGVIYSDEDKIDLNGKRSSPYFKCDFNYELLLAQNCISHLGVYRRDLVNAIGGFRAGYEGSQDYDLVLRAIERLKPDQIVHIPWVLYHWRMTESSTAMTLQSKPYALTAARKAIADHLVRRNLTAAVLEPAEAPDMSRVRFAVPSPPPMISIIIPTRDRVDLLRMCVDSILKRSTYPNYEVIVVDNGSVEQATFDYLGKLPANRVRILRDERPFNYSALNNAAVAKAYGEYICLLNNDIEVVTPDWMEEMLGFAACPGVGAVGARLWYPNGLLQHGGVILGLGGVAGHSHKLLPRGERGYFRRAVLHQALSAVTAACLLISKKTFISIGGLDETLAVAFNDVDLCLRVREAGYRNVWTPYAELIHHESASRGADTKPENQARANAEVEFMKRRWGDVLKRDPAYSPHLTLEREDFGIAFP